MNNLNMNTNTNNYASSSATYDKFFSLSRVIGLGTKDNYSITCNRKNGLTVWMTGPFLILYDVKSDKQLAFLKNKNNKVFNCVAFSEDGLLLACGEGNCRSSEIIIYEINFDSLKESKVKTSIKAHKFGVDKLKFFGGDKFLMSIGDRADKTMQVYNLQSGNSNEVVFSAKYNRPILCFDICENFLLLGGSQFLKVWSFDDFDKKMVVSKHNVDMGKLKDKSFSAGVIYNSNVTNEKRALLLTSDGHLAELKYSTKQISRWVHLKSEKGISLCVYDQMLVCGCGDGIIRIFKIETLEHFSTLHRPPPLGRANIDSNIKKINISSQTEKFADVVTLSYNSFYDKLISIYSDKTFFVWDLNKSDKIYVDCYNSFHSGSINNMEVQVSKDNILAIATCSDDKTVKLWNFKMEDFEGGVISDTTNNNNPSVQPRKIQHIAYSKIIRRIFYFSKNFTNFKFDMEGFIGGGETITNSGGNGNNNLNSNSNETEDDCEISAVKFSPDEKYLICGDIFGNLHIFNLVTFEKVNFASAHNAQISCIDFITTTTNTINTNNNNSSKCLLTTGSMDNLINVIDVSIGLEKDFENYERSVIDDHQAPVTNVIFLIDKLDQVKLISCSADRSINFYLINSASSTQLIQKFQEDDMNTYCLAFNPVLKQVIAGHNGKVTMWRTKKCVVDKIYQMRRGETLLDNFRIAVDNTGSVFATSNNDKYIRIRSVFDGQLITKIPIAESVSSLVFSINNNYLIASSVEGYIYFFKVEIANMEFKPPKPLVEKKKMKNKLKLLQRFMNEDVNFSKNEKVQALIEKMKNSEDVKLEDLKLLDSYFVDKVVDKTDKVDKIEGREDEDGVEFANKIELLGKIDDKETQIQIIPNITEEVRKSSNSEVIELKEEKANPEEEEEDSNKNEGNSSGKNVILNRSTIFEKNLKEISAEILKKSILNHTRVSLCDTYQKKKALVGGEHRNEIHIPRSQVIESVFKKVVKKEKEEEKKESNDNSAGDSGFGIVSSGQTGKEETNISPIQHTPTPIPYTKPIIISSNPSSNSTNNISIVNPEEKIVISHKKSNSGITNPITINPVLVSNNNNLDNPNSMIKNNNFLSNNNNNKKDVLTQSESQKVLMTHQSKKNLRDKEKESNNINTEDLLNLQQLVSETCKKVDNIDNKVNQSSELKKLTEKSLPKKDEEFDYFSNDERLSMIKGLDLPNAKDIPKANNIFKKNLHEADAVESVESNKESSIEKGPIANKFSNFVSINLPEDKKDKANALYEIVEDLHMEDEISNLRLNDVTIQTHNFEVSDTMVNKDKFSLADINSNSNTFVNQSLNNPNNETFLTDTTRTMMNNIKDFHHIPTQSILSAPITRRNDCVTEKFSFSINTGNGSNLKSFEKSLEMMERNFQIEDPNELLHIAKLMKNLTYIIENKLKESGHLKEEKVIEPKVKELSPEELIMEAYLEKYSELLIKRIDQKLNK